MVHHHVELQQVAVKGLCHLRVRGVEIGDDTQDGHWFFLIRRAPERAPALTGVGFHGDAAILPAKRAGLKRESSDSLRV
ncbi:hypothetical protein D9M70_429700 [compost metagenome]